MALYSYVCAECSSSDLVYTGNIHWDEYQQALVVTDTGSLGDPYCVDCGEYVEGVRGAIDERK